jgi:transcriptional regulator with XRE-family HTH domain
MMADWNKRLRAARRDLGLSTADLATRAGLSTASVRAYETGRRHPTREHLSQILDCVRLDRQTRNELFVDAGLAPDAVERHAWSLSRRDVLRLLHERPWPAFALNDVMEVVAASRVGMRLTGLAQKDLEDRVARNVLVIAARIVAAQAVEQNRDWGTITRRAIARMKAVGVGTIDNPDPYFAAVLERIARGGASLMREFSAQWEETPARGQPTVAWAFPARWTLNNGNTLRLHCVATRVNTQDPIEIHDFIPADAASSVMLERIAAARLQRQA